MPLWLGQKLYISKVIKCKEIGYEGDVLFTEDHEAHAAFAFYPSPFDEAAILNIDGVGEWATGSYRVGKNKDINLLRELHFPDSVEMLYSAFTYSARLQTVNQNDKSDYYGVISGFKKLTGCAVVVNTGFNVRGEPIICSI